jgi:plastocyanin
VTNLATKLFGLLAGLALIAAIGYAVVVGDRAGADLFVVMAGGLAVAAAVAAATVSSDSAPPVAADAPAPERRNAYGEGDVPSATGWPVVAALAATAVTVALAAGASWLAAAIGASVIPAVGWLTHVWREHPSFSAKVRQRVSDRLVAPVAMPVLATIGALFIAAMVSRVLLAIPATASWVTALILAAGLMVVLWMVASRPRVPSGALVGIAAVSVLSLTVAGALGAKAGERKWEPHESGIAVQSIEAKNLQFTKATLEFPADSDVEVHFVNADTGTFHNVAFYTSGDANRKPLFAGKPIPDGHIDYKPHTPAPGTYAFFCDFHPAMTGKLVIVPARASHSKAGE